MGDDGVIAGSLEVVAIDDAAAILAAGGAVFTAAELAFARSKRDPERRLAARLAAKRAACRLLGGDTLPGEVEVLRGRGEPPRLALSRKAELRLRALGASRVLVSLTHGETHAAAAVVLVRDGP